MNRIIILKNDQVIREVPMTASLTIGRHPSANLQLEDPLLSRTHVEIFQEGERYFLRDLQSSNGTFLNSRKLAAGFAEGIKNGDVAQLGHFVIRFDIEEIVEGTATQIITVRPMDTVEIAPPPSSPLMEHLVDPKRSLPIWQGGETALRVADIIDEAPDVKTFRMVGIEPILFSYKPGQFATFILDIDGKKVLRSYSLSSSPSRPHTLEITVKRVPGGLVSNWLQDNVKIGDAVRLKGPSGKFSCFEFPSQRILFIAAGSGITPLMSMSRWILDTTADVDVRMFVSARSPSDIVFCKELEMMSARHSGFKVAVTVTSLQGGAESWLGLQGRCTAQMLEVVAPDILQRHIFMCGPAPFMDAVKEILRTMGFPLAHLHVESFGGKRVAVGTEAIPQEPPPIPIPSRPVVSAPVVAIAAGTPPPQAPPKVPAPPPAPSYKVTFAASGKVVQTDGKLALLDLAEANGIDINYACRAGSCGSCKVRCKSGRVEMQDESGLASDEKQAGYILTCVGFIKSDVTVEA